VIHWCWFLSRVLVFWTVAPATSPVGSATWRVAGATLEVATATLGVAGSQGLVTTGHVAATGYWVAVPSSCWSTAADLLALVGLEGGSDNHQGCQAATGGFLATWGVTTAILCRHCDWMSPVRHWMSPVRLNVSSWLVDWQHGVSRGPVVA
jgi:hypothetical protein